MSNFPTKLSGVFPRAASPSCRERSASSFSHETAAKGARNLQSAQQQVLRDKAGRERSLFLAVGSGTLCCCCCNVGSRFCIKVDDDVRVNIGLQFE